MALVAFGINHRTASVALREKVAFAKEALPHALQALCQLPSVSAAMIVSTCNRTEIFADTDDGNTQPLLTFLSQQTQLDEKTLDGASYHYEGDQALSQMIRVASGIDSLVLGEPQILGQMKVAFEEAAQAGTVNGTLSAAFQHTLTYAKKIRSQTGVGQNPVSVAYAAISLAQRIFADMTQTSVLLIGAGETIELVARHLVEKQVKSIHVASRTLERADRLAKKVQGESLLLADLADVLPKVDIVVASTASQLPLLGKGLVERVMHKRRHKPLFMVDIAVPRDIEPEVGQLNDVYLYTVDDLSEVVEQNRQNRLQEVEKANVIIAEGINHYQRLVRGLEAAPVITAFRKQGKAIEADTVQQALLSLEKGESPEKVVTGLARLLTNRLLHKPSHNIKRAVEEGDLDAVKQFTALFDLPEEGK